MLDVKNENTSIYAIMRDLKNFLDKEFHLYNQSSLFALVEEEYYMGLIDEVYFPSSEDVPSDVYKIEIKEDYIDIIFVFISMMVSQEMVEDYLCDMWRLCRKGFLRFLDLPELKKLKERGLGVRIKAFAGIGGEGYHLRSATLFTPEDLKHLI